MTASKQKLENYSKTKRTRFSLFGQIGRKNNIRIMKKSFVRFFKTKSQLKETETLNIE